MAGKKAAADAAPSTAVATRAGTELTNAPEGALDFLSERRNQGMERVSMADIIMPRVNVLQDLSPQVKKNKPEYVEGAKVGQLFNAATRKVMDTLLVLPCHYIRHHIEWKPNRGGFVTDHGEAGEALLRSCKRNADNYDVLPNGNLLVPTPTWYCLDLDNGGQQIVVPMPRTQSRTSRQWMSFTTSERVTHPQHGEFTPPMYFRAYKLGSTLREDGENDWYVFTVDRDGTIFDVDRDGNLMARATQFRDMLVSGEIKADASHFDPGEGGDRAGRAADNEGAM
jgi:hypothetical protein